MLAELFSGASHGQCPSCVSCNEKRTQTLEPCVLPEARVWTCILLSRPKGEAGKAENGSSLPVLEESEQSLKFQCLLSPCEAWRPDQKRRRIFRIRKGHRCLQVPFCTQCSFPLGNIQKLSSKKKALLGCFRELAAPSLARKVGLYLNSSDPWTFLLSSLYNGKRKLC